MKEIILNTYPNMNVERYQNHPVYLQGVTKIFVRFRIPSSRSTIGRILLQERGFSSFLFVYSRRRFLGCVCCSAQSAPEIRDSALQSSSGMCMLQRVRDEFDYIGQTRTPCSGGPEGTSITFN